ncbi:NACHT, LRR and PYD domains-containing protein 12-like [Clupea harengus]|uniref:NACHT, LRR and PYD domains-containing protein 12-like n=1 Tax=Clupea harengus TaxID=7950 RepID=A0A8M1K6E0_CLUHA|nr:NACHT, LRR and PYD domains-containing protein 12-like [Clupea harengus]
MTGCTINGPVTIILPPVTRPEGGNDPMSATSFVDYMKHSPEEDQENKMMPGRMSSIPQLMLRELDDLSKAELLRFKIILKGRSNIPWQKLKEAVTDEIVKQMVQKYSVEISPKEMLTILRTMGKNQLATDLERKLGKECDAAHTILSKKASLKQKLQKHLEKRFSVVHQDSGGCSVQDIYTDLYIVEGRTGGVNNTHEVSAIDMRQTGREPRSQDKQVKLANMFTDNSVTNVLTLGIAGVGKSVAVQKFVMDWVEKKANQDIDFVFVLPFRELNQKKGEYCNLLDVLESFYPYRKDLEYILGLSECKILFVLDGLDESRLELDFGKFICTLEAKSSVDMLITSLIKGMIVPSALLWVTTRPAAASLIPKECFNLVTEVQGFNDLQKDEFFQNNIKNPEKAKRLVDHINKNRSLHIMCHMPVFCRILANLVDKILEDQSKEESAKTLTELYTLYSVSQIKRMDDKYSEDKKMSAEEKGQILVKLGKLAFKHVEKGTQIFYEKDLKKCDIDVNCGTLQAGVCTQIFNVESATTGENMFSFVHLSVQEFLAALYVLNENATHGGNCLSRTWREKIGWLFSHSRFDLYKMAVDKALQSPNGHLDLFVRFLVGLAPMLEPEILSPLDVVLPQLDVRGVSIKKTVQYIKKKTIREDISPERIINLFHCLNELGDNSLDEEINRYINSADEEKNLTPAQCSALAYLLLMSAKDMIEFDLKKYLRSEEGLRRLLPVVKVSRRVWLNQCRLSKGSCKMMASVLQGTPSHLTDLDISDNDLQDEGMELLCVGLGDPRCKLETLSCEMMASVLQGTPSHLRELDMSNNDLQDVGMELLCVGLRDPHCKMETLSLNKCQLSKTSCEIMASVLQRTSSHLRELEMRDNDLQDEGVEVLCVGLRDPQCKMETLRLSGCLITHKGCSFLASALKSNPSYLKQLDLSYNHPGSSGVKELTDRLNDPNCKLETFRVHLQSHMRLEPQAPSLNALRVHLQSHMRLEPQAPSLNALRVHLESHMRLEPQAPSLNALRVHLESHMRLEPQAPSLNALRVHLESHMRLEPQAPSLNALRVHLESHMRLEPQAPSLNALRVHLESHMRLEPQAPSLNALRVHLESHMRLEPQAPSLNALRVHLESHMRLEPQAPSLNALRVHLESRVRLEPQAPSLNALRVHLESHMRLEPQTASLNNNQYNHHDSLTNY